MYSICLLCNIYYVYRKYIKIDFIGSYNIQVSVENSRKKVILVIYDLTDPISKLNIII